ncbi:Glutathione S-transferase omega-like [Lachnellula occidentalis]|uniref:Glutathione S-transferase omega-like n=1 Tax=Lachnellula occidentalis TaxID=215460 RepID=A0A8H8U4G8_9HELO|nr:Glutathione S-transferase omega-like [Lachnellula occidentalis]
MATKPLNTAPQLTSSFTPPPSKFQGVISPDPTSEFPAEKDRYALYLHLGCPWAHRTNIVYQLKRLQPIVALSVVSIHRDGDNGWNYDGTSKSDPVDPVEGFKNFKEMYKKADSEYQSGYTVPLIWDRKKKTIVNNDSVGIMRILATAFDAFLAPELREDNKPGGGLRPDSLAKEIDELGNRIELRYNWGTYLCGMAKSQADYDASMSRLFGLLDELEKRLSGRKYLLGDHLTETDIRAFTTSVRFDMAYYTIFMCNYKMIRYDYPNLHRWLRQIYYEVDEETKGAFRSTTHFEIFMEGYAISAKRMALIPWGPAVPIMPLDV